MAKSYDTMTLQHIITEAFHKGLGKETFGKSKKSHAATAEKLATWFSDYYGRTDHKDARKNIFIQAIILEKIYPIHLPLVSEL